MTNVFRGDESSRELLKRARQGEAGALSALFRRQGVQLQRWARGRLPGWARQAADTADLVQDALFQTVRRIDGFEDRGRGALQAYLRQAVQNRIRDELRRHARRRPAESLDTEAEIADAGLSPHDEAVLSEDDGRYRRALMQLSDGDRVLVVGRLELDYTYEQLALISGRAGPEAARIAVRRAVQRLAETMANG